MARASIHQLITMLADESQSVDVDFPQVREWLQELIQLRDQMSKIKAQYPSLAPQEQPYGVFEDYEKHNVEQEQPFIQQMEAEALEASNQKLLQRIERLQRVLQERDDKITELRSQVGSSERAAAARERRVADLEKHNRNLATEIEKLRSDLVQKEHILAERSEAKVAMQERTRQLLDELQDARRMLGVRQESIYSMNAKIQSMEDQIKTLTEGNFALASQLDKLRHMLETANADRRALSEEIERLGRVCEVATTRTGRLTPLEQVFKEQAPFELTDSQVIMLVWLLEHTPNARQRTAYVCEGCGQPMVNRDGGQMANPCQCEPGVGRKTVGVF